jgi:hypothetical protein
VAVRTREIYRSANGDRWLLARDPDTGRVFGHVTYLCSKK